MSTPRLTFPIGTLLAGLLAACGAARAPVAQSPLQAKPAAEPQAQASAAPVEAAAAPASQEAPAPDVKALLQPYEGRWTTRITWASPDFPKPLEWAGNSTLRVLGGRWLVTHHEGAFMGMGFEAQDVTGFDARTKTWRSVWADKVNDSMLVFEAPTASAGLDELIAETVDDKGAKSWLRRKTAWKDPNTFEMSFSVPQPAGGEQQVMTITATRAQASAGVATP